MHFEKINILLLVLVFSLDHVRSDESYDAAISDDADVGVDDQADVGVDDQADSGVDDQADVGVDDQADAGVDDQADAGVDDQADSGVDDQADAGVDDQADTGVDDQANEGVEDLDDNPVNSYAGVADGVGHIVEANEQDFVDKVSPCTVGTHFRHDCNICFCYKPNVQGCTNTDCSKQATKKLSSNPAKRLTFKKLRDRATGCVPGEKIKQGVCECSCAIPSVLTCPENCL